MLKKIYLDLNAFKQISTHGNKEFTDKVKLIDKGMFAITYSVAHLEELKSSNHYGASTSEHVEKDLSIYDTYADKILKPDPPYAININGKLYMEHILCIDEYAEEAYEVISNTMDRNDTVEAINREFLEKAIEANNPENDSLKILLELRNEIILYLVNLGLIPNKDFDIAMNWKFSDIKEKFYLVETYIELAFQILEMSGMYEDREKIKKKKTIEQIARSWTHDTSHVIYASYCEFFISNDEKLRNKAKAIYKFLEVPTVILDVNEFIDYKF